MKTINNTFFALLLLLVVGCTKEPKTNLVDQPNGNYNLAIDIDLRAPGDDPILVKESEILTARVIVVANEGKWMNRITCNQLLTKAQLVGGGTVARALVRSSGLSDIYVFINETSEDTPLIEGITTRQQFNNFQIGSLHGSIYEGTVVLRMLQQFPNVNILPSPAVTHVSSSVGQGAERLCAKVRVTLKAVAGVDGIPDLSGMKIYGNVGFKNFSPYGYMFPKTAERVDANTLQRPSPVAEPVINATTWTRAIALYLPECIYNTTDKHLEITLYGEAPNKILCEYRVTLNSDMLRNTIYDINCSVKGYGSGDMIINTKVTPWDTVSSTSDVGGFMKVSNLEYIILDRPLQIRDVQVAKVSHNLEGEHKNVVTAMGDGLTLQGTLDPTDKEGGTVLPDAADLPKSVNHAVVEKVINVNLSETFTSGTVKIDMGGQFRQNVKITRAPYLAQKSDWERYELGTGIVYVDPTGINNEWIKVSNSYVFSIYMLTISGPVSKTAPLYVYINRSVASGSTGVGLNIVRETNDAKKETVRCSYALPRMGNLLIARRDMIGQLSWTDAMTGTSKGCKTLGTGWRVPTQTELLDIKTNKKNIVTQVGGQFLPDFFWS
ncbi:MAG: hypothetical protein RSC07_02115, partial [Mucinivorans sp.]